MNINQKLKELERLSQRVRRHLEARNWKLVTVESCTGGMVAETLTSVAGSSQYFDCGFVTYSNESKVNLVGVNPQTIALYGAVSEQTASEMVEGGLRKSSAQVGVAITGIAGPGGGTAEKPVGTVYFALQCRNHPLQVVCQHFLGDRNTVRRLATRYALEELLKI